MSLNNTQLTLSEVKGPLDQLNKNLTGNDGRKWLSALNKFLRKEDPWNIKNFDVWKTVKLGTWSLSKQGRLSKLKNAIKKAGFKISAWTDDVLNNITLRIIKTEVDLILVSVRELGFKDGAGYKEICHKALEFNLDLCPAEVGLQLRLQYPNQPKDECIRVAMEPIKCSDFDLRILKLAMRHDGDELGLFVDSGFPDCYCPADDHFVFIRRKK